MDVTTVSIGTDDMTQVQTIEQLSAGDHEALCGYLKRAAAANRACGDHDPRWLDVLREALDHRTFMIVARRDGDIVGCLPLSLVTSRLFGRFLVSLPYLNRGGVVADDDAAADAMVDEAAELARIHNVQYLELRHDQPRTHKALDRQRDEKVRMVLRLPGSAEGLWDSIHSKVRNQIRKGDKSNLTIRFGGLELVDDFYNVFSVNMRDLGTPVYSRRLFTSILERFPDAAELAVVDMQGQPVAAALLVHDPLLAKSGQTQVPSASSLREFNQTNANMWMYHHLLNRAIERGADAFDFGRSSVDSGTYRFKKQWGAEPEPTVWQYHLRRGDINAVRPDSPRYRRKIETWQKLPVWLTRLIGPGIVRGIP